MRKLWPALGASVVLGCATLWTGDPQLAFIDWAPPGGTNSYIELASRYAPWKRSALWLICGANHQLRLALKTRLPGPELIGGVKGGGVIFTEGVSHELDVLFSHFKAGLADTMVSDPLSNDQINILAEMFGDHAPPMVNVQVFETGTYMSGQADGANVSRTAAICGRA